MTEVAIPDAQLLSAVQQASANVAVSERKIANDAVPNHIAAFTGLAATLERAGHSAEVPTLPPTRCHTIPHLSVQAAVLEHTASLEVPAFECIGHYVQVQRIRAAVRSMIASEGDILQHAGAVEAVGQAYEPSEEAQPSNFQALIATALAEEPAAAPAAYVLIYPVFTPFMGITWQDLPSCSCPINMIVVSEVCRSEDDPRLAKFDAAVREAGGGVGSSELDDDEDLRIDDASGSIAPNNTCPISEKPVRH